MDTLPDRRHHDDCVDARQIDARPAIGIRDADIGESADIVGRDFLAIE